MFQIVRLSVANVEDVFDVQANVIMVAMAVAMEFAAGRVYVRFWNKQLNIFHCISHLTV